MKLDELMNQFYVPTPVGTLNVAGKVQCFGWCADSEGKLVALSVQGSVTGVRAVGASIWDNKTIILRIDDYDYNTRPASTRDRKYVITYEAIPDSNFLSMFAFSETLLRPVSTSTLTHIPHMHNREDTIERFYHRLKQIVQINVLPEWKEYLWQTGIDQGLMWPIGVTNLNWQSKGFNIYTIRSQRDSWHKIISDGLKFKKISLGDY